MKRNLHMWYAGFAFGIPVISLFTFMSAYSLVDKGSRTHWDSAAATKVINIGGNIYTTVLAAVLYVALIAGVYAGSLMLTNWSQAQTAAKQAWQQGVQRQADLAASNKEANKDLPKQIDAWTSLSRIDLDANNTVTYTYVIMNSSGEAPPGSVAKISERVRSIRSKILTQYCSAKTLVIGGARWSARYVYWLPNSAKLAEFDFSATDCAP
jgi:hypothetical protein